MNAKKLATEFGKYSKDHTAKMVRPGIITRTPNVMDGKPCIRGQRITVGGLLAHLCSGATHEEVLKLFPTLTQDDILAALEYAMWRSQDKEVCL